MPGEAAARQEPSESEGRVSDLVLPRPTRLAPSRHHRLLISKFLSEETRESGMWQASRVNLEGESNLLLV